MQNLVLYRKYRPKNFSQVINQEHIKTTLANAVSNNRIGHAYLFVGPRGVGKTTLARIFARAINMSANKTILMPVRGDASVTGLALTRKSTTRSRSAWGSPAGRMIRVPPIRPLPILSSALMCAWISRTPNTRRWNQWI